MYHMLSVYMAGDNPQHSWARLLTRNGLLWDPANWNARHPLAALLTLTWLQLLWFQSGSATGLSLLNAVRASHIQSSLHIRIYLLCGLRSLSPSILKRCACSAVPLGHLAIR